MAPKSLDMHEFNLRKGWYEEDDIYYVEVRSHYPRNPQRRQ